MPAFVRTLIIFWSVVFTAHAQISVPTFALFCGVRVGYDTMGTLESAIGTGLPQLGGHARGARLWRCPTIQCDIRADQFYYYDSLKHGNSGVIDSLDIEPSPTDHEGALWDQLLPIARLPARQFKFLGTISLGTSKDQTFHALDADKFLNVHLQDKGTELILTARGYNRIRDNIKMTKWTATLHFAGNKLAGVDIESE